MGFDIGAEITKETVKTLARNAAEPFLLAQIEKLERELAEAVPSAEALRIAQETLGEPDKRAQVKVKLAAAGLPLLSDMIDEMVLLAVEIIRLSAHGKG